MAYWKDDVKPKRVQTHQEDAEQEALVQWCWFQSDKYKGLDLIFAIPNGGARSRIEGARFKRTGVKKGVPDLFLPVAKGKYHGLFIEMKRRDGGRLSPEQAQWNHVLNEQGYLAVVCKGFDEAVAVIETYYKQG